MRILVLGVGNLLLSDEAIGVRVVEALERRYHLPDYVEIMDGGTAGMELMEAMASQDHLIIVDAVLAADPPGSVLILRDAQVPALFTQKISPHQLGLSDVLSGLHLTDEFPKKLTLVGVVPASLEPKIGLTPTVAAALDTALEQVLMALREDGVEAVKRENNGD